MLVSFDNILMYSLTLELHLSHLRNVLETFRKQSIVCEESMCLSCEEQIKYMRRIIYLGHGCNTIAAKKQYRTKKWGAPQIKKHYQTDKCELSNS